MALILTGSSGSTTLDSSAGLTFSDSSNQQYAASPYVLKNRIINGDMRIDQRNAGASVTQNTSGIYTVDRWAAYGSANSKFTVQRNAGSVTPPAGFTNYAGCTSSSAYTPGAAEEFDLYQYIEGYNIADLAWGTANAKTVTLSFWVRSSLTGTFGAQIANYNSTRSYPFSYTISAANTWEQKTITITGDTTGTWYIDNGAGMLVNFSLGAGSSKSGTANTWQAGNYTQPTGSTSVVGTNGATFYITGVQLEVGSTATPFERRLYNQELANCQRYCSVIDLTSTGSSSVYGTVGFAIAFSTNYAMVNIPMPVPMRTKVSSVTASSSAAFLISNYNIETAWSSFLLNSSNSTPLITQVEVTTAAASLTTQYPYVTRGNNTSTGKLTFSAEL